MSNNNCLKCGEPTPPTLVVLSRETVERVEAFLGAMQTEAGWDRFISQRGRISDEGFDECVVLASLLAEATR